jgi:hypothetical protein
MLVCLLALKPEIQKKYFIKNPKNSAQTHAKFQFPESKSHGTHRFEIKILFLKFLFFFFKVFFVVAISTV